MSALVPLQRRYYYPVSDSNGIDAAMPLPWAAVAWSQGYAGSSR